MPIQFAFLRSSLICLADPRSLANGVGERGQFLREHVKILADIAQMRHFDVGEHAQRLQVPGNRSLALRTQRKELQKFLLVIERLEDR